MYFTSSICKWFVQKTSSFFLVFSSWLNSGIVGASWIISSFSSFSSGGRGKEVGGVRMTKERVGGFTAAILSF